MLSIVSAACAILLVFFTAVAVAVGGFPTIQLFCSYKAVQPAQAYGALTSVSIGSNKGWAVSASSDFLRYANGKWQAVSVDKGAVEGVDVVSDEEAWAVGWNANILHYKSGCWTQVSGGFRVPDFPQGTLHAVTMLSSQDGWIVGDQGILRLQDGIWRYVDTPPDFPRNYNLYDVEALTTGEAWAVGDSSTILHYSNGSWKVVRWTTSTGLLKPSLRSISMSQDGEGWAVGDNGLMVHYSNGLWQQVKPPADVSLHHVQMLSADEGWATGKGVVLHYSARSWSVVPDVNASSFHMVSNSEGWFVNSNQVFHYLNGNWSLDVELTGRPKLAYPVQLRRFRVVQGHVHTQIVAVT